MRIRRPPNTQDSREDPERMKGLTSLGDLWETNSSGACLDRRRMTLHGRSRRSGMHAPSQWEWGFIAGEPQRFCLPVFRQVVKRVGGGGGVPLGLQRFRTNGGLRLRVNLPLDGEAGSKGSNREAISRIATPSSIGRAQERSAIGNRRDAMDPAGFHAQCPGSNPQAG